MEILAIIGILFLIGVLFTGGGILGWLLKGFGGIFDLLWEGNEFGCGCILKVLFWIFIIMLLFFGLL